MRFWQNRVERDIIEKHTKNTLELFEIFECWGCTVIPQLHSSLTSPVSDPQISSQLSVDKDELCRAPRGERGSVYCYVMKVIVLFMCSILVSARGLARQGRLHD